MAFPEILFHYTSLDNLVSILGGERNVEGAELWASDLEFMNDPSELIYACRSVRHRILEDEMCNRDEDTSSDSSREFQNNSPVLQLLDSFESRLSSDGVYRPMLESRLFSVSFCRDSDLLSMWRGYGRSGGAAIGFDIESLIQSACERDLICERVEMSYGDGKVSDLIAEIQDVARSSGFHGDPAIHEDTYLRAFPLLASCKDSGYSEEEETRLVYRSDSCVRLQPSLRATTRGLVPYINVPVPETSIKTIVLGPSSHADRDIAAISRSLQTPRGYWGDIKITQSTIPFIP